jgi:hypothetical protein
VQAEEVAVSDTAPSDGLSDYRGRFDADFHLGRLSRAALARLGREYMLAAHVQSRVIMPLIATRFGPEAAAAFAIDAWRGASPVFNARNRRLLRIEGDGMSAILKGLQFDVGAPHQYMDFRFELVDERRGFFWLDYCGALDAVSVATGNNATAIRRMCHDIEDPTFNATVMEVNPRARCRAIHRPPLADGHTGPVCRWEVSITAEPGVVEEHPLTHAVRATRAGRFEFTPAGPRGIGGIDDYSGPFLPDLQLEDLSRSALIPQCKEFALDVHLLVRAGHLAVRERWGSAAMIAVARDHWAGSAPVYGGRLRAALHITGDDMEAILKTLQVEPAFPHEYVRFGCALVDPRRGYFWVEECEALADEHPRGWLEVLDDAAAAGLDAVVGAVNSKARCYPIDAAALAARGTRPLRAWRIEIDDANEPLAESPWARVPRACSIANFTFRTKAPT